MVPLDTLFDLLSNERRRYALYYLHEQRGPVAVDELVEAIARWEDDPTGDVPERYDRIELSLQHNHLPKTAEVEYVEYRPEEGVIETQGIPPEADVIVTLARIIDDTD